MAYAITQSCCNDASCVSVCPVNCIHPAPGEPDFGKTEMLYVDPIVCIDCGACADACPVDAVKPVELLRGGEKVFAELNADFYKEREAIDGWSAPTFLSNSMEGEPLRIAVVGAGPAASYAARTLLTTTDAEISIIDKLPVPGGLVRAGVAPDHMSTKKFSDVFAWAYAHPRTRMFMNVEVGTDVTHDDLLTHHDAVIYGVGARSDRPLGIPGEGLTGVHSATDVVGWYNGHTEVEPDTLSLSCERAVVIGNGNVALDIARILLGDVAALERTDIADHTLEALRDGSIREVVLLGRRGPNEAAFTRPELLMLPDSPEIDVVVEGAPRVVAEIETAAPGSKAALLAALPRVAVDLSAAPAPGKRIVFSFYGTATEVIGDGHITSMTVASTFGDDLAATIQTGLLIRSTGHRGAPLRDLPFEEASSTVPNDRGRVVGPEGDPLLGTYVVGWIKRGATGGIGANRTCAEETVAALVDDASAGVLKRPRATAKAFGKLVAARQPDFVGLKGMQAIEAAEVRKGKDVDRPRVKFTSVPDMLAASRKRTRL